MKNLTQIEERAANHKMMIKEYEKAIEKAKQALIRDVERAIEKGSDISGRAMLDIDFAKAQIAEHRESLKMLYWVLDIDETEAYV